MARLTSTWLGPIAQAHARVRHVLRPRQPVARSEGVDAVRRMARARGMCTAGEVGGVASGGRFGAWVEKVLESSMGGGGVRWSMERVVHAVVYRNGVGRRSERVLLGEERERGEGSKSF
ncbi:hypothetical protein AMTR_s02345p00008120 [Amborella trichopoda]|uniref:Uncharacterized protein n=1 Tax=Amborella trichopoda TaxID=13333 RepID=U5D154_AMBTC|nr:hypothetical protein AMTR_s02345p00008120 [Amborella trichopoda]